jgi:PAS domain S-box-containing protein
MTSGSPTPGIAAGNRSGFRFGIRPKAMAVVSVLVLIAVAVTGILVYHGTTRALLTSHRALLVRETMATRQLLGQFIDTTRRDVLLTSQLPAVTEFSSSYCTSANDEQLRACRNRATQVLLSVLRAHRHYHQISIVSATGHELLRVHSDGDYPSEIPAAALRELRSNAAFRAGLGLKEGGTLISDAWSTDDDTPTGRRLRSLFHSVTPVFTPAGQLFGLIMLEADLNEIVRTAVSKSSPLISTYVSDNRGNVLVHADSGHATGLRQLFPQLQLVTRAVDVGAGTLLVDDRHGSRQILGDAVLPLEPGQGGRFLRILLATPYSAVVSAAQPRWIEVLGVLGLAALLTLPIAFLATGHVVQPLLQMSAEVSGFQPGQLLNTLPVNRRDELGTLAQAFSHLVQNLAGSEARQRAMIHAMQDAHVVADANMRIVSFNPAAEKIFGYAEHEIRGEPVNMLLPEQSRSKLIADKPNYQYGKSTWVIDLVREVHARRRSGEVFPVELMVSAFEVDGEKFCSAVMRDISARRATEERLRYMAAAIESAEECMEILGTSGEIIYINPAYERTHECTLAEVRGKHPETLRTFDTEDGQMNEMVNAARRGVIWHGILKSRNSRGTLFVEDVSLSPIRNDQGQLSAFVVVKRDISEKLDMEQQLLRGQKLEAVGQLAAGIAHEINTPIQFVSDNIRFLKDSFGDIAGLINALNAMDNAAADGRISATDLHKALQDADTDYLLAEIPKAVDQSLDGVGRVARIVRAMKDFSHPATERTPLDINRAIASTATVASNEWKYVAQLQTDFDPDLPQVPVMPGDFNQVILNMIVNAAHAIGDVVGDGANGRGTITLSTRRVDRWAEIRIADTGCGMTPEIAARIFDPFFTTKAVGKGTGQGLSITHNVVVDKHAGTIRVESTPGVGTTFIIRLPLDIDDTDTDTDAQGPQQAEVA